MEPSNERTLSQMNMEEPEKNDGAIIIESSEATFNEDVIKASTQVPIIVDFWAPWCEPCKQLTPVLEKLAIEYAGKVKLAKINIDENQALAQQLRVQSIPMIYAFKDGQPVDGFNGALPESQLRKFIEKLTGSGGSPLDQALEEAKLVFDDGNATLAEDMFTQILMSDDSNAEAHAGLIKCFMSNNKIDQARDYLAKLPEEIVSQPAINSVQKALELDEQTANIGEVDELKAHVTADPKNPEARYNYALALYASNKTEEAISELIEIIKQKRDWNDGAAKQQLFKIFEALGHSDSTAIEGRKKLSALLFA